MSNVPIKYLKDENGNKFSPIVSTGSIYTGGGYPLNKKMELLYSGELVIPSRQSGNYISVALNSSITNIITYFEWLSFIRGNSDNISWVNLVNDKVNSFSLNPASVAFSTWSTELMNIFALNVKYNTSDKNILKIGGNCVIQVWEDNTRTVNMDYTGNPIYKIYGIRR